MEQFQPWCWAACGGWVAKEGWGQAAHGHRQALLHALQQRWIEGEQHGIMRLNDAVLLQGAYWIGALMKIAAGEKAWSWPLADSPYRGSAEQKRIGVLNQHSLRGPAAAFNAFSVQSPIARSAANFPVRRRSGAPLGSTWVVARALVGPMMDQQVGVRMALLDSAIIAPVVWPRNPCPPTTSRLHIHQGGPADGDQAVG